MPLDVYYLINENDEFECHLYEEIIPVGKTVCFLFDSDTGTMLKHGTPEIVKDCMVNMIRTLTQASIEMPDDVPEEVRKEVCDMKEALTLEEFKVGDIDCDTLNKFINNTGYYSYWKEKGVFHGKK